MKNIAAVCVELSLKSLCCFSKLIFAINHEVLCLKAFTINLKEMSKCYAKM